MDFHDSPSEAAFRDEVRGFIAASCPEELRAGDQEWGSLSGGARRGSDPELGRAWRRRLAARGWLAPAWPVEYGGAGMGVVQQFILSEELAEARAPAAGGIGLGWAGPTIILYGTPEQKQAFLPPILSDRASWCQLFSEPGAGSDLASLQTRAERDGDDYVVNGQKIWTSGAHRADWGIMLARTDPDAPKHRGISYLLVNMKAAGISVQPLVNMVGNHDFNQVYFDNVRVPRKNLLGEENRGWYIGTSTLDFERSSIASSVRQELIVRDLIDEFRRRRGQAWARLASRSQIQRLLAERLIEANVGRLLSYRVISMQQRGLVPNYEASIAKLYASELEQRVAAAAMTALGPYAQIRGPEDAAPFGGRVPRFYLYASPSTIGGGTGEIQRNIIATRGLGLPRA
jgi:alkylation response protein AidB-like acyl-CoA dehydrogenase